MTPALQEPSESIKESNPALKAVPPTPTGKMEYTDGTNWYNLATENFVINTITTLKPCLAATTANLAATYVNGTAGVGATLTSSASAVFSVDGVTPAVNARILVKDQTTAFQNGLYIVTNVGSVSTSWVLTRATDYDSPSQMIQGGTVDIASGTINGVSSWMQTASVATVGTSNIVFARLAQNGINSVVGTANQILVTIVNNVATLSIAPNPVFPGTASATLPGGTTAQRPVTLVPGMIRFNNGS
jgi:hypothetical protein